MAMSTGKVVALIQAMGGADPAVIESAVQDWLDAHPEATTTVQDGSITEQKLATSIAQKLGLISSLSDEIDDIGSDVTDLKSAISDLEDTVDGAKTSVTIDDKADGYWSTNTFTNTSSWQYGFADIGANGVAIVDTRNTTNQSVNIQILDSSKTYVRTYQNWIANGVYTIELGASEKYLRISAKTNEISSIPVYKRTTVPLQDQITEIKNKEVAMEGEVNNKVSYKIGRNKFDKNNTNKLSNVEVGTNGKLSTLSDYISFFMPITGGEVLTLNAPYTRLGFCTAENDLTDMASGDDLNGWIWGSRQTPSQGAAVTVPATAKYMIACIPSRVVSTLQIENTSSENPVTTPYRPYETGVPSDEIMWNQQTRYVGAGASAGQQYATIQDAVDSAFEGDTIIIMPGTYDEAVFIAGTTGDVHTSTKDIRIIGFNRDECILTHDIGDYYYPPLEIASGVVENMTIIGTGTTLAEGATQFAYCAHIDYNSAAGKSLQFKNCRFVNTCYPCVGAATRANFKLSFIDCIFECDTSAAFLFHEEQTNNNQTQSIQFENCTFISNSTIETIHVQESDNYTGNKVKVDFERCIVKNTSTGLLAKLYILNQSSGDRNGWLDSKIYELANTSALNSDSLFDK